MGGTASTAREGRCGECGGNGYSRTSSNRCRSCLGTGRRHEACPGCGGSGHVRVAPDYLTGCSWCRGRGRVEPATARTIALGIAAHRLSGEWLGLLGARGSDAAARAFVHAVAMGSEPSAALRDALEAHGRVYHLPAGEHCDERCRRALLESGVRTCEARRVRRAEASDAAA